MQSSQSLSIDLRTNEVDDDIIVMGMFVNLCYMYLKYKKTMEEKKKQRKKRRWSRSVRPSNRMRIEQGQYHYLFLKIKEEDPEQFFKYTRMSIPIFNLLLSLIAPKLTKRKMITTLSPEHRLAMTLLYLSQGCSMQVIARNYLVGKATVSAVIKETCTALWEVLSPIYLKRPDVEDLHLIATDFQKRWQFPNCCGAIDEKHIKIQAPKKSGTKYFNYKKKFSIVLLATCDSDYNFVFIDIGAFGSQSDVGIFTNSTFGEAIENKIITFPPSTNLPNYNKKMPHVLVADEAFPLQPYIMRPYPEYPGTPGNNLNEDKRIFNYRLSRARRVIENSFGILVSRWRIYQSCIIAEVDTVEKIIAATICLHNFIRKEEQLRKNLMYCPTDFLDRENECGTVVLGEWRNNIDNNQLERLGRTGANYSSRDCDEMRDILKDYFISKNGAVSWQWDHVNYEP